MGQRFRGVRPSARCLARDAWGRTLASIYSVRPTPRATVSTPLAWEELEGGAATGDFSIETVPERVRRRGDLWKGMLAARGRTSLARFMDA